MKKYTDLKAPTFLQKAQQDTSAVRIDVRTPSEFDAGHLKDTINIDIKNPDFIEEISELPKHKTYYVYCSLGIRSANACAFMQKIGFDQEKLFNLKGGLATFSDSQKATFL